MSVPARADADIRHATTVAIRGRGLMIEGQSGRGKSALALELLSLGARLVADDGTALWRGRAPARVWADAAAWLPSRIEARGLGLLPARLWGPAPLYAVLSLDHCETVRLPEPRVRDVLGVDVALLHRPARGPLAAALIGLMAGMTGPVS